jgi:hypothetical protein
MDANFVVFAVGIACVVGEVFMFVAFEFDLFGGLGSFVRFSFARAFFIFSAIAWSFILVMLVKGPDDPVVISRLGHFVVGLLEVPVVRLDGRWALS